MRARGGSRFMGTFNDPNQFAFFHLYDDSGAFLWNTGGRQSIQSRHGLRAGE